MSVRKKPAPAKKKKVVAVKSKKPAPPKTARKLPVTEALAREMAQLACDLKARNIRVLDLRKLNGIADFFVLVDGTSDRHVQAIADEITLKLKARGERPLSVEGYSQGHWILLDYGMVIAHVFFEEVRKHYALDKLWSEAGELRLKLK